MPAGALYAVSVLSHDRAWAVGEQARDQDTSVALVEAYDGARWAPQHISPPRDAAGSSLSGVDAVSADDVWAVGYYTTGDDSRPLVEHWNGSRWRMAKSPSPSGASLAAVAGAAASDVWAAGRAAGQPLLEHWDGQRWSIVDFPSAPGTTPRSGGGGGGAVRQQGSGELTSLSVVAADDVWAAGETIDARHSRTLVAHWDGAAWTVVPSPTPGQQQLAHLSGISAAGPSDVWAVGDYAAGTALLPLIEHWDGESWTEVEAPHLTGHLRKLTAVTARSGDDAWAVGLRGGKTVILHWDGESWTQVKAPPGGDGSYLSGVDADAADDAGAVGADFAGGYRPLFEHWDGIMWR